MFNFVYKKPKVVAEIGCNHMGDLIIAKELVTLAKESGAEYVKFQKRDVKSLLSKKRYNEPHPVIANSFGKTYGEHREYLEFNINQMRELKEHCDDINIFFSSSVWDVQSAIDIVNLRPSFIKVPSAVNNNYELLKFLRDDYDGKVQLSLGMTKLSETEDIVKFFEQTNQAKNRLIIYACTSGYPVPSKDVSLLEINRLYSLYSHRVNEIGFSGHHLGIAIDVAAYTLGAVWIERHFTKDRTWKGTDHAASLEPTGLKKLIRDLQNVYLALNYKEEEILTIEIPQIQKLKYKKI